MTEPVFTRDGSTDLYWADPAAPIAAFLATDPGRLGDTPTLTRTWSDSGGVYAFLGAPAGSSFGADLRTWLDTWRPGAWPRFVWVPEPALPPAAWSVTELAVSGGRVAGADFLLTDYRVSVPGGSEIEPGDAGAAGWGFVLADPAGGPALVFSTPSDVFTARPGTTVLSMVQTGTWQFTLDVPAAGGDGFARLGAGMRYFTPDAEGWVRAVHFGVVSQPATTDLVLHGRADPLRPFDAERTSLSFFDAAGDGAPPALPSGYATAYGHGIELTPLASGSAETTPARLVFGFAPWFAGESVRGGYYLVPEGPFRVTVVPPPGPAVATDGIDRIVCGTSGLEYLGVPAAAGCSLTFVPGRPAFAPLGSGTTGADALTGEGTTSWVYVESPPGAPVRYYSQPEDAPLYAAPPVGSAAAAAAGAIDLLGFLEIPAADLPGGVALTGAPGAVDAFPMAPFRGLAAGTVADALVVEQLALAPRRRTALLPPAAVADATGTPRVGITPQGLGVGVAADGQAWDWLGIGHAGDPAPLPELRFTTCTGAFQQAMQTNNLFLVLGNAAVFASCGSVAYRLTESDLEVVATLPPGRGVRPPVLQAVRTLAGRTYATRELFRSALVEVTAPIEPITPDEELVFLRFGGLLTVDVGGWRFRLSPDNWGPSTYLVFKFVLGRTVAELADDLSTWAWPAAAGKNGEPAEAQRAIQAVVAAARQDPAYAAFAAMVHDPDWTGVLALSADVPLTQLPGELQVLAAGIDPGKFGAHHVGISVTPYRLSGGQVRFEQSSMFGLIDYRNPEDQYATENIAYAFRVLQLTVGIRNSVVTTFTSRAELLVNRLFGTPARLFPTTHGNNVIFDGALQRQRLPDGTLHDSYVFSMPGENRFRLDGLVLQAVDLLSAQLTTARTGDARVEAVFRMGGDLRFYEPERFDPFCWGPSQDGDGYLRFGNLGIAMSFPLGNPEDTRFTVLDGNLSFDGANSKARAASLVERFPIRLAGLVATADPALAPADQPPPEQSPADLGFVSISAPIDQSVLAQPWYGLDYRVDLGTLGALAGGRALALRLLVAWSPGKSGTDPSVYVGVQLPGAKDLLGVSLPLQGVVKLGFKGIELIVDDQPGELRTYTLRLRDFALRLLSLAFPPGHNDVILFGDPAGSGSSKVGWYLAYASDADPKRPPVPPAYDTVRALRPRTRA